MKRIIPRFAPLLVGALLSWPLLGLAAEPAMEKDGMLVDAKGMVLYTYDKDAAKAEGEWSLVKRDDGSMQWAYDGKPLYTFINDKQPGEVTGDGKMGVWHVAKP